MANRKKFENLFPRSYWKSKENRRKFMDGVAKKLNVKSPMDWGKVTIQQVFELGGGTLLSRYYKSSLYYCLQSIYEGCIDSTSFHIL